MRISFFEQSRLFLQCGLLCLPPPPPPQPLVKKPYGYATVFFEYMEMQEMQKCSFDHAVLKSEWSHLMACNFLKIQRDNKAFSLPSGMNACTLVWIRREKLCQQKLMIPEIVLEDLMQDRQHFTGDQSWPMPFLQP